MKVDRIIEELVSVILNDRVQEVNNRLIKISLGWQGGARECYKYAKGVVSSLYVVVDIKPGCCGIIVCCSRHKTRML